MAHSFTYTLSTHNPPSSSTRANTISGPRKPHFVCSSCLSALRQVQRASNSTSSATATTFSESHDTSPDPSEESTSADPTLATSASPSKTHIVKAAVLLSRAPLLTRDLTTFEKSYFLYQKRLNERLALPFTRYFYYGRNTPGEVEWKRKIKERLTAARDIGRYVGYGKEAWNDEVVLGTAEAAIADPDVIRETLVQDSEQEVKRRNEEGEEEIVKVTVERPMPRRTEADERTDLRSLNRAFTRTLYLLVKGPEKKGLLKGQRPHGEWTFPMSELREDEPLDMVRCFSFLFPLSFFLPPPFLFPSLFDSVFATPLIGEPNVKMKVNMSIRQIG